MRNTTTVTPAIRTSMPKRKAAALPSRCPSLPLRVPRALNTVLFIDDGGTVKEIETAFIDGHLVFALERFSEYVVVNTKTVSETPDTGDNAMLAPFAMLLALSFAGVAVLVSGKKKLL